MKYGGEVKSLVDILNESKILENRGIAIVPESSLINYIFLYKEKHEHEGREAVGYVIDLLHNFEEKVSSLFDKQESLEEETTHLTNLRYPLTQADVGRNRCKPSGNIKNCFISMHK